MSLVGATVPRIYTPPLRELTESTSLGFECVAFATIMLRMTLDPWQAWFLIHALETLEDGSFRFRTILLLVARQNGKTTVIKALILWAMYTGRGHMVVGTAQDRDIARRTWLETIALAKGDPELAAEIVDERKANGQESLQLADGSEYIIKATTSDAGRGVPGVDLLVLDELRTHKDFLAWGALSKTTNAKPNALKVCMTNAGDNSSVVLNSIHASALAAIESGGPTQVFLAEYSAPPGCALDDREGWVQANPSLGRGRLTEAALEGDLATDPANVFRTECLCQRVADLDEAIDVGAWKASADPGVSLRKHAGPIYAGFDVSLDGAHATLVLAGLQDDGRYRAQVAATWRSVDAARADLAALLGKIKPAALGWYPSSPAAELAPILRPFKGAAEIKGLHVSEACMGLAGLVRVRQVLHPSNELLDSQITGVSKLHRGDRWEFTRRGAGHADAAYALAAAIHVSLTVPAPPSPWKGAHVI